MNNEKKIIQDEWIQFVKTMKQDEESTLKITERQYKWFGIVMSYIKEDCDFPIPCGTVCRKWPRAFFRILKGGKEYSIDFLTKWITSHPGDYMMLNLDGRDADYDLLGYNIHELLMTDEWKEYIKGRESWQLVKDI